MITHRFKKYSFCICLVFCLQSCGHPAVRAGITIYSVLTYAGKVIADTSIAYAIEETFDAIFDYLTGGPSQPSATTGGPLAPIAVYNSANSLTAKSKADLISDVTAISFDGTTANGRIKVPKHYINLERIDPGKMWTFDIQTERKISERHNTAAIQAGLNALGFREVGPVDGLLGKQTQTGLRNFQRKRGLPVSGQPDHVTLNEVHRLTTISWDKKF